MTMVIDSNAISYLKIISGNEQGDRIQFFRNLSGISHLGFQQNLKFAEASGDLSKPELDSTT